MIHYAAVCTLCTLLITSCRTPLPPNYNRPMAQNILEQLNRGMGQHEVKKILGSPSIIDIFHPNLWIYLFMTPDKDKTPWQILITMDTHQKVEKIESRVANLPSK